MKQPFIEFLVYLVMIIAFWTFVVLMVSSCGTPKISDVMPADGVRCKADITLPDGRVLTLSRVHLDVLNERWFIRNREGEPVTVGVRIYDCE